MTNFLVINSVKDINFKNMLNDYRKTFVNHTIRIKTNYNLLSSIDIFFSENDFPHLMGWQKVINRNKNSTNIIKEVDSGKFTVKEAKVNVNWKNIRSRMLNYNLLHEIFINGKTDVLVMTSDMKPNRLKLDVVFVKNKKRESVIFGLRKVKNRNVFVPTTLHTESIHNKYNLRRRTKIVKIEWIH